MCNIFVDDYPSKIIYFFFKLALFFPMTTSFLKGMRTRTDKFKKKESFEIETMKTCICSSNI